MREYTFVGTLKQIVIPLLNQIFTWFVDIFAVCGINIISLILLGIGILNVQKLLSNASGNAPRIDWKKSNDTKKSK